MRLSAGDNSVSAGPSMKSRVERPILVVDDNVDVRSAIAELLRQEGYTVVEATNGSEALQYLLTASATPSLLLLDLNMPVMSGWEVIRAVRGDLRFANLPIILVTGERRSTDSANQQIVGRISKPFLPDDMLALVKQHVVKPPETILRSRDRRG